MADKNERTMTAMLASFYAASRVTTSSMVMYMNAASLSGMLLHLYQPRAALEAARRMPCDPIWKHVVEYLEAVVKADQRDTLSPVAAGGDGR